MWNMLMDPRPEGYCCSSKATSCASTQPSSWISARCRRSSPTLMWLTRDFGAVTLAWAPLLLLFLLLVLVAVAAGAGACARVC